MSKRQYGVILFAACLLAGCAASFSQSAGTDSEHLLGLSGGANAGKLPQSTSAIVKIEIESGNGSNTCTGTLINPRFVLTAGHCFINSRNPDDVQIHFANSRSLSVTSIFIPGNFNPKSPLINAAFDLALLELEREPSFPVQPLALASSAPQLNQNYDFFGYGETSSLDDGETSSKLNYGQTQIHQITKDGLFDTTFKQKASGCPGDSGGPLALVAEQKLILIGVTHSIHPDITSEINKELKAYGGDLSRLQESYPTRNFCKGAMTEFIAIAPRAAWIKSIIATH